MKEESSGPFNAVVASVITVIAVTAALIGLFVYCRFNIQRVTQQTQRHQAGVICLEALSVLKLRIMKCNRNL